MILTEFLYQKFDLFDRSPIESFNPGIDPQIVAVEVALAVLDEALREKNAFPDEAAGRARHRPP